MAKPTDAELDEVKDHLLLFKPDATTKLPLPMRDNTLDYLFAPMTANPWFADLSFGILLFPNTGSGVRAFFHNPDDNWDIGSAGKLSIVTAGIALLTDMRALKTHNLVTSAEHADALMRHVWTRHPDPAIQLLSTGAHYPQPSMWMDFSSPNARFAGAEPDYAVLKERAGGTISPYQLSRSTPRERMHLTIGHSDNRAARASQGQLGIGYINAVHQKLGLFNIAADDGAGIRIAGDYGPFSARDLPSGWRHPQPIKRAMARPTMRGKRVGRPYVATVRALSGLMTAIVRDKFIVPNAGAGMLYYLELRGGFAYGSYAEQGVIEMMEDAGDNYDSNTDMTYGKLGVLYGNTEFFYGDIGGKKFGLIFLGLLPKKVGADTQNGAWRAVYLAKTVWSIIRTMPAF